jgi:nucleotide-binding universal stress UspA family protein
VEPLRVVVGWESAERSGRALERAGDLATRLGAGLDVVHVRDAVLTPAPSSAVGLPLDPGGTIAAMPLSAERLAEIRQDVEADVAGRTGGAPTTVHVREGWPPDVLTAVADEVDAYVVVVGGPAHGFAAFLEHLVTGSVAHELEKRSHRPVLVVPSPT